MQSRASAVRRSAAARSSAARRRWAASSSAADIEAAHLGSVLGVLPEAQPWAGTRRRRRGGGRRRRRRPRALRARLVPQLVHALHHTLHDGGGDRARRGDADAQILPRRLDVATLVADERHRLYAYFDAPALAVLLKRFRGRRHARRGVRGGRRAQAEARLLK